MIRPSLDGILSEPKVRRGLLLASPITQEGPCALRIPIPGRNSFFRVTLGPTAVSNTSTALLIRDIVGPISAWIL